MSFTYFNKIFDKFIKDIENNRFDTIYFSNNDVIQLHYVLNNLILNEEYIKYMLIMNKINILCIALNQHIYLDFSTYYNIYQLVECFNNLNNNDLLYIN